MPYVIMIDNGRQYSDHWHFPAAVAESETMAQAVVTGFQRWVEKYHELTGDDWYEWDRAMNYFRTNPPPLQAYNRRPYPWTVMEPGVLSSCRELTAWYVKVPEV